ncbi:GFA family protein [Paraburkholderia pallida]|uniref:CENP-V/GFA domain-containing protein n=1 Tax=Paraburkholderia pallida TaxID=2547399 RepID=A0A4P7D678_9BURK|nr:GFA family protein [Paraburkholderia pallida]QBR02122.1 hypothetical protein E1956_33980 [Paraburkholderia pallida]
MSRTLSSPQHAACECGACRFEVGAAPAARFICHCKICQVFTGRPFSDVTIVRAKSVSTKSDENIAFKKYRLPPNIRRGLCKRCGKPAIELGGFGPLRIAFIPTPNFAQTELLPSVALHMFYDRRCADATDTLPKYSGYLPSQLAFSRLLMEIL